MINPVSSRKIALIIEKTSGVLVAISIPIFTNQLEKSREATDLSNCRAYYSEIASSILTGDLDNADSTISVQGLTATSSGAKGVEAGKTFTVGVAKAPVKQTVAKWQTAADGRNVAGVTIDEAITPAATMTITYTFTVQTDGDVMLTGVAYSAGS